MDDNTTNMNIPINPVTPVCVRETPLETKVEVEDDSDWTTSICIPRHFSPIRSGSESFVHPIYLPEKRYPTPWEVDVTFLPNNLTKKP